MPSYHALFYLSCSHQIQPYGQIKRLYHTITKMGIRIWTQTHFSYIGLHHWSNHLKLET